jgi:hypothetical protein
MLALIIVVCLTAIQAVGTNANNNFNQVQNALRQKATLCLVRTRDEARGETAPLRASVLYSLLLPPASARLRVEIPIAATKASCVPCWRCAHSAT